ncbi:hypothetical protein [Amycolatopsis minnesotensis]
MEDPFLGEVSRWLETRKPAGESTVDSSDEPPHWLSVLIPSPRESLERLP